MPDSLAIEETETTETTEKKDVKGSYVSIHSSGFRDFLLKAELEKEGAEHGH